MLNQLPAIFKKDAWIWFQANQEKFDSLASSKKLFQKEFLAYDKTNLLTELLSRTQEPDEDFRVFLTKFQVLSRKIQPTM